MTMTMKGGLSMHNRTAVLVLTLATALSLPIVARGQLESLKNTTPEERAKIQTDLMKSKLDLTPDQVPKVSDINLKYAKKMEPIIKGSAGPFKEMREMRTINEEKEGELKTVLSADQFKKLQAMKDEMRKKFEERISNRAASKTGQ
jgi:hypothetical protein